MQRMMAHFFAHLTHGNAILVRVQATQGSVPREVGAWMAVFADIPYFEASLGPTTWFAASAKTRHICAHLTKNFE